MARRRSIVESLRESEEPTGEAAAATPAEKTPSRLRRVIAHPASRPRDSQRRPRRYRGPTKPAQPAPPAVLAVRTGDAKRVGLYLHPDNFRALGMAKLDDGADANARIRAMLAPVAQQRPIPRRRGQARPHRPRGANR